MEFNIGERVRIRAYEDMPEGIRNKGVARNSGKDGEIVDKLWSAAKDCMCYHIKLDGMAVVSNVMYTEGMFDRVSDLASKVSYVYEFDYLENVVVARFYEVGEDHKTEIARGHGHIIHEGVLGIAQASAYALKRIMYKIEGGNQDGMD